MSFDRNQNKVLATDWIPADTYIPAKSLDSVALLKMARPNHAQLYYFHIQLLVRWLIWHSSFFPSISRCGRRFTTNDISCVDDYFSAKWIIHFKRNELRYWSMCEYFMRATQSPSSGFKRIKATATTRIHDIVP